MVKCEAFPEGQEGDEGNVISLSPMPKTCACCIGKSHMKTDHPEVVKFAKICLGSEVHVDFLSRKFVDFPFEILQMPLRDLQRMGWPLRSQFKNKLKGGKELSEREYTDVREQCRSMGVMGAYDLLTFYCLSDSLILGMILSTAYRGLFREFGLNVLEFNTISRFSHDVAIRSASASATLEFLPDQQHYEKWNKARWVWGGERSLFVL